jgi:hypothetical protein
MSVMLALEPQSINHTVLWIIGISLAIIVVLYAFPYFGSPKGPIRVTALWIYPIKSCAGIKIDASTHGVSLLYYLSIAPSLLLSFDF